MDKPRLAYMYPSPSHILRSYGVRSNMTGRRGSSPGAEPGKFG
eukprot:CAMPEP_0119333842 /NCGR_PEP_ID=MMETSP1333-20130426/86117_1 /TAXON_ID=418940 /ORGANISM="Scyphosphaera apsteinii, Strain RCC1455" /LENGTH=42 /DNA_ID= /DNA_START= /DNA_END= /DNA_ORIENTATION=